MKRLNEYCLYGMLLALVSCASKPKTIVKTKIVYKKKKISSQTYDCVYNLMTEFGELTDLSKVSDTCNRIYFNKGKKQ